MKKAELVDALASQSGQTKAAVEAILDGLPEILMRGLANGGSVVLPGVAKIDARHRDARTMRNPANGQTIEKAATTVAAFKPVKGFKEAVAALTK